MKKQLITALLLAVTQTALAGDPEYVGGNRYHCTGSNCAVLNSIQNSNTTQPQPYRQSESVRFAREYKASEQPVSAESQKLIDDHWNKFYDEDTKKFYREVEAIKAKQALDALTVENNAIYAKGVEDGKNSVLNKRKSAKK